MKKLPVGIQAIEEIINEGYAYVDKTDLIFDLITKGKYYFLSRPRRFGKSLLVSTLKAIFSGNKTLFKDCQINTKDYDWKKHPIIHLDFSEFPTDTTEKLEIALREKLEYIAHAHETTLKGSSLELQLGNLIKDLSRQNKVVFLVDEYDKPLIDNLSRLDVAAANRNMLKSFLGVLKGLDNYLKFIFVTGVSKFSQVSLFSGINHLEDITIDSSYATLLGYTEEEINLFFKDHLIEMSKKRKTTPQELISLMRHWYNGYGFSRENASVYNPFSVLLFLKNGEINNYWFQTATPTFLINLIKKQTYPLNQISGIQVGNSIFNNFDLEKISLISLMWQTGYLTIKSYDPSTRLYYLDYPNEEVKVSFLEYLAEGITNMSMPQATGCARECAQALYNYNLEEFFHKLKLFFADIPYDMHVSQEKYYQTVFYVIGKLIGLDAQLEVKTNIGRIDMVVTTDKLVYIFEFKIDASAEEALSQIRDNKYFEKYSDHKKKLILVGVNFDTKERNITDWNILTH